MKKLLCRFANWILRKCEVKQDETFGSDNIVKNSCPNAMNAVLDIDRVVSELGEKR